jgi:hypothetical protein
MDKIMTCRILTNGTRYRVQTKKFRLWFTEKAMSGPNGSNSPVEFGNEQEARNYIKQLRERKEYESKPWRVVE